MRSLSVPLVRIVLVAALAYLVGCGTSQPLEAIPLRTLDPGPLGTERACMAALTQGTLVRHPGSGLGLRGHDGRLHQVVWPRGYRAVVDGTGVVLVDETGSIVGRQGGPISLGGGEIDDKGTWSTC